MDTTLLGALLWGIPLGLMAAVPQYLTRARDRWNRR